MKLGLASNFKNEFQNIEGIWKIFEPIVDQWLVVDSGSEDNTPWKLKEVVGNKLKLIQNDMIKTHGYAYSRTKLIELSSDMDWVLVFDGDERMCPDDAKKIRHLIETDPPYDMIWLPRIDCHDNEMRWIEFGNGINNTNTPGPDKFAAVQANPDWQPRLIRRTMIDGQSKVHFKRAVHEVLVYDKNEIRELRDPNGAIIEHYGRLKTLEKRLSIRDLCKYLRQEHPQDFGQVQGSVHNG